MNNCKDKGRQGNKIHEISSLPKNSVIVIDSKSDLAKTEDESFWNKSDVNKLDDGLDEVIEKLAPLMRSCSLD